MKSLLNQFLKLMDFHLEVEEIGMNFKKDTYANLMAIIEK